MKARPDLVVENDDVYAFIELKSGRAPELVLRERSQCERLLPPTENPNDDRLSSHL